LYDLTIDKGILLQYYYIYGLDPSNLLPGRSTSFVGLDGVETGAQVEEGVHHSQASGGQLGFLVGHIVPSVATVYDDEEPNARTQTEQQRCHMVHCLKEGLGEDGGGGNRPQRCHEKQRGRDEAGRQGYQEEQLGQHVVVIATHVAVDEVPDDGHGHDPDDHLQEFEGPRQGLDIANVDEDGRGGGCGGHAVDRHLRRHGEESGYLCRAESVASL